MTKKMKIKYAVCIPLILLSFVVWLLSDRGILPEIGKIFVIVVVGICIVVMQSEMIFYVPRKQGEQK